MGLANFRPWIADNKLPFFPGFTDHGVEHVESVMRGAEALITDDSWAHLGPRDAAALILSILLHDCAMHIHEDGFLALVSRAPLWEVSGGNFYGQLQNPPWPELWDNFKREASRFDDKKLTEIFGSPHNVSPPPNDLGGWTRNHYLYIGEFIRRHHARMAHEIALAGIPGPSPSRTQLHFDSQWFADLVGFIARSHHLNLRTAVDLLPYGYRRDYRGVHVPFVMAVLRIADYIEISAPRAPKQLLAVKMLRSPLSQKEWMKHAAVVHVKMDENDPEALSVDAAPEECTTFLGLRNLFGGIQKELDSVWSSLGEVYGNDAKLRDLKIGLRRIKSTLDNLDTFGKSVAYLPVDARFRTSNGSMLGLLAGPLYGHNPAFGVRELMQNAVDACCERADYQGVNPNVALDLAELEADVVVFLEEFSDGTGIMTVEDSGIGMTQRIVLDYFLTVGASFRDNEAWHSLHDDAEGRSRVFRAGRFGIGIIAAFLIGEEIRVSTRHVSESRGLAFSCRREDQPIELRWCSRSVGTTIEIRISDPKRMHVLAAGFSDVGDGWDWYVLQRPKVVRKVKLHSRRHDMFGRLMQVPLDQVLILPQRETLALPEGVLPENWVATVTSLAFGTVYWTWGGGDFGLYMCNGFRLQGPLGALHVSGGMEGPWIWNGGWASVPIKRPRTLVFDRDQLLPVNLVRTGLSSRPDELDHALLEDICRDMLAAMLVRLPISVADFYSKVTGPKGGFLENLIHPGLGGNGNRSWLGLWIGPQGAILADGATIGFVAEKTIGFSFSLPEIPYDHRLLEVVPCDTLLQLVSLQQYIPSGVPEALGYWSRLFWNPASPVGHENWDRSDCFGSSRHISAESKVLIVSRKLWDQWRSVDPMGSSIVMHDFVGDDWVIEWMGDDRRSELNLDALRMIKGDLLVNPVGLWFDCRVPTVQEDAKSPLGVMWTEIIGQAIMPWDLDERHKMLAGAYENLSEEVGRWQKIPPVWVSGNG